MAREDVNDNDDDAQTVVHNNDEAVFSISDKTSELRSLTRNK